MVRKVYTVKVDDEKLASAGSKQTKINANNAEKEVQNYGILEINNNSSKGKIKNLKDAGFQKNVTNAEKKSIKATISKVDDYFDFSFRPEVKVEEVKKTSAKRACSNKSKAEIKNEIIEEARTCEIFTMTDEAKKVVNVAREGSLFG